MKHNSGDVRLPDIVYAQASPHSIGGRSLPHGTEPIDASTVHDYGSEKRVVRAAAERLRDEGFEILRISPTAINIAGPPARYEETFATTLFAEARPVRRVPGGEVSATFVECRGSDVPGLIPTKGTRLADELEGVAIEVPTSEFADVEPPHARYRHLRVPAGIVKALNAGPAHARAVTGRGVRVAMVDSGWYPHPFFAGNGYRPVEVHLGPAATDAGVDRTGHGTAESANLFAVAPDVELAMVKRHRANVVGAFDHAVSLEPHILSCSWGTNERVRPLSAIGRVMEASVATAVKEGIVVVCAAGNGEYGFPAQHPDVIAVGGATVAPNGTLRASSLASGFHSRIYRGRTVPDVCGVIGSQPSGVYLMLPVPPGSDIDRAFSKWPYPFGDNTSPGDGWAALSGTSAAAPQVAGVCALILQVRPEARPGDVKKIVLDTARDVRRGTNHPRFGHQAIDGHDTASGWGLVDADRAAAVAAEVRGRDATPRSRKHPRGLSVFEARKLTRELVRFVRQR